MTYKNIVSKTKCAVSFFVTRHNNRQIMSCVRKKMQFEKIEEVKLKVKTNSCNINASIVIRENNYTMTFN